MTEGSANPDQRLATTLVELADSLEGPCRNCFHGGVPVTTLNLAEDADRWPALPRWPPRPDFAPGARRLGDVAQDVIDGKLHTDADLP